MRTKLTAVLLIPAIAFVAVASGQTSLSVRQARGLSELAEQVALGGPVSALVHELQAERDRVVGELAAVAAGPAAQRDRGRIAEARLATRSRLAQTRSAFDDAVAPLRDADGLAPLIADATAALAQLDTVQAGLDQGWLRRRAVADGYTRAVEALLDLLRAPSAAGITGVAESDLRAYQDLAEFKEASAQVRGHAYALANAGRVGLGEAERFADARQARTAALERFRTNASAAQLARFDDAMHQPAGRGSARLEQVVLDQAFAGTVDVDPEQWWSSITTEIELVRGVERVLLVEARERVTARSDREWASTLLVTGVTLLILIGSLLASIGIGRSVVRSLRRLRGEAIDIADIQLPGLLARLRGTTAKELPTVEEVAPVSAGSADEVGEVAEAFTQVHRSAVTLAVEQAMMRHNVNAIFVNLARRSQVLVERQLELLDELERDETEPGQLRSLFRLDHLATRMRRNNESLLVLTGNDMSLPRHRPVPLAAVIVAAVAEIEKYQQVRDGAVPDAHIAGRAVADLVHLLAELLDNATAFSARGSPVTVTGRRVPAPDAILLEVRDRGLGMSAEALAEANALLAEPPHIDVAASERMGLVVVSHLAARRGIRVRLTSDGAGVRASVWLPDALLTGPAADEPPGPTPVARVAGRRVRRAEDVLAAAPDGGAANTWWSGDPISAPPATSVPLPTSVPPRVAPATTSTGGLPVRVPLAQLPEETPGKARGSGAQDGWRADLDPEQVGSVLSQFYRGVRRAESEDGAPPDYARSVSGEPEPGST